MKEGNLTVHSWATAWGNRPEAAAAALPAVNTSDKDQGKDGESVEDLERDQQSLDDAFEATVKRILSPYKPPKEDKDIKSEDDENKVRPRLLLGI